MTRSTSLHRGAVALVAIVLALGVGACGSSSSSSSDGPAKATSTTTPATTTAPATGTATNLHGKRYCEVLLVHPSKAGVSADVYNSYPLNDCPDAQWKNLDMGAIAKAQGVPVALANGPRYWLMDHIQKTKGTTPTPVSFGGIDMILRATVALGSLKEAAKPYVTHAVDRSTVFSYDAGSTVYELHAPDGTAYVMQTWSQQVNPKLAEADLAGLGTVLTLPAGWSFSSRTLTKPLQVVTTTTSAHVLQDNLRNSYSQETAG
jgi:hypothetical protein